ncbi:MAG TPA: phosphatidate cytidylyltransferase [Syntrophobacteria bacterium]|nr:phosphatidate cytidylyltransferase [Syntrophobacteria bacterium]
MAHTPQNRPHLQRWLTAAAALPLLVAIIAVGPSWLVTLLVVVVATLGLLELARLLLPEAPVRLRLLLAGGGILLPLAAHWLGPTGLTGATVAFLFVSILPFLFHTTMNREILRSMGAMAFAQLYIPFTLSHLVLFLRFPSGRRWVFLVLAVIFAGDTGAFYSGRFWGSHRLAPVLSPKKTVEGAIGGLVASLIIAVLAGKLLNPAPLKVFAFLLLGLGLALVGQLGDLMESMIKRASRVKDAGALLPGHGGMLDRLDSLLFAFPLTYYVAFFLI